MIGNPKWFETRKYSGWGLKPKTWQGWLYITLLVTSLVTFQYIPYGSVEARLIAATLWLLLVTIDILDIMIRLKKDERERAHEAVAERNGAWFMVTFLSACLVYQLIKSGITTGSVSFDPIIIIALTGAALIKLSTHVYPRDK